MSKVLYPSLLLGLLPVACTSGSKPADNVIPFTLSDFQEVRLDSGLTIPLDNTELTIENRPDPILVRYSL